MVVGALEVVVACWELEEDVAVVAVVARVVVGTVVGA